MGSSTEPGPVPETKFARTPAGSSIAYQVIGGQQGDDRGVTVISVPPMAQNIEMAWEWPAIRRMFERFGTFARFVAFDKRGSTVASAGAVVSLPCGIPHIWQVTSAHARFLTINAGRRTSPSFDQFVASLGTPTDPQDLPAAVEIDPAHVAQFCAAHGIEVLGPPPAPLAPLADVG